MPHVPVLTKEILEILEEKKSGNFLDCTFGAGGHARSILEAKKDSLVYATDKDETTQEYYDQMPDEYKKRCVLEIGNFQEIECLFPDLIGKIDGIIMDIGVSSMQIDNASRGFSFMKEGPLNMSMNQDNIINASTVVNTFYEDKIAEIIKIYGEEEKYRAIAAKIVKERRNGIIETTTQLANIVRSVFPYKTKKIDNATKTFQAIRIFVNNEIEILKTSLTSMVKMLNKDGIIMVISFHGLEDKIVKNFFKDKVKKIKQNKYSREHKESESIKNKFEIITKKPITPGNEEIKKNIRSRSAKLRAMRKLQ
ncbi:16S rRNA (cytosine(1402)-N(4))-methyltransferase RsmH [Anaplasmataceae bacterium AB001_6]|nr:16S rRNA (cytosine(1402)-N(4))-methyltransferase RsmH [Anaplasmataceae bacterium AB001_6]